MRWTLVTMLLAVCAAVRADDRGRYSAVLVDGTQLQGDQLRGWHEPQAQPTLGGIPLLAPDRPMRWLSDSTLGPAREMTAYVETVTGDRIPGRVVAYHAANQSTDETLDAYFEIEPAVELRPPQRATDTRVRVVARYVRRIVWQHHHPEIVEPGTAILVDGARLRYRSARFSAGGVRLLLQDGQRSLSFGEIATFDFQVTQPSWMSILDELAVLAPDGKQRLIQIETAGGLVATTSLDRYHVYSRGNVQEPARWVHGVQPVWSSRVLWVPHDQIWMRRMYRADEIPLTRLLPSSVEHRSLLTGSPRRWRTNRNVDGEPLRSGGRQYGWGFGLHAPARFQFALPPGATVLDGSLGLDHAAGRGGSVRGRILAGERLLLETPLLVGSSDSPASMRVSLSEADASAPLTIVVDPLAAPRPEGADPLDIRDFADWLEPVVSVAPRSLADHLAARRSQTIEAWRGWRVVPGSGRIEWPSRWDEIAGADARFYRPVVAVDTPIVLEREVTRHAAQWLIVAVSRLENVTVPPVVEVRVDGELAASHPVPARNGGRREVTPLVVPLAAYFQTSDSIRLEIRQQPGARQVPVRWHAIRLAAALPTVACLVEDEGDFRSRVAGTDGRFLANDRHSGELCLELTAPADVARRYPAPFEVRERPGWGQYRFIRFAFRKSGEGRVGLELFTPDGGGPPIRYDAGGGEPTLGSARRVWNQQLPDEWIVITRDLFADFGAVDVDGLRLIVPDGERALVDHIYLARSTDAFVHLPPAISPQLANQKARRALADEALRRALPATVRIRVGDGRLATGVIVDRRGLVLTAGHTLAASTESLTIELADGRFVAARRLGIDRDLDLGLIKIESGDPWPAVTVRAGDELAVAELFVALAHQTGPWMKPAAHLTGIRRQVATQLWTDFDLDNAVAGGPLVDRHGTVVGIHTHRSQFGGFYYSRPVDWPRLVARLETGDVWGRWLAGTGPVFGVELDSSRGRCEVIGVVADSPAAAAGIKIGDVIQRIDQADVQRLEQVYEQLAERSPGDPVSIEVDRDGVRRRVEVVLMGR